MINYNNTIRVRFAPSPTGNLHIGNLRTAIFNWLFAKKNNGKFLLRIENTDKKRSNKYFTNEILHCLSKFNINYDEEIYYQNQYKEEHLNLAKKLIQNKNAYFLENQKQNNSPILFRIPLNTNNCKNIRIKGPITIKISPNHSVNINYKGINFVEIDKNQKNINRKSCLSGFSNLIVHDINNKIIFKNTNINFDEIIENNKSYCFNNCSRLTFTRKEIFFTDLIKGNLIKSLDNIEDFIIIKNDNSPIFHLSNVYDDQNQKITHIIRGNDHIDNTFKHILMFYSMNKQIPKYAHLPMIINNDNKPYSKRDGDVFVLDFFKKGFLYESLFNYLSSLSISLHNQKKITQKTEIIKEFKLENINKSPAKFNFQKLLNINSLYINNLSQDDFCKLTYDIAKQQLWGNFILKKNFNIVAKFLQSRTKLITEVNDWKYFFFDNYVIVDSKNNDNSFNTKYFSYEKSILKKIKTITNYNNLKYIIKKFIFMLDNNQFSLENIKIIIESIEKETNNIVKNFKILLRIIITGKLSGINICNIIHIIGKKRMLIRLNKFINDIELIF